MRFDLHHFCGIFTVLSADGLVLVTVSQPGYVQRCFFLKHLLSVSYAPIVVQYSNIAF